MKRLIPTLLLIFLSPFLRAQESFIITSSGYNFVPSELNAVVGDSVKFDVGPSHTARQVSEATWNANGTEALQGGFDFTNGEGVFVPAQAGTVYYVCSYHVALGMKGTITVSEASSIDKNTLQTKPTVYPNPASDILHLNSPSSQAPSSVIIFDMTGKAMLTLKNPGMENRVITITVQDLHQGLYFVKLEYPGKTYILKFIKI